MRNNNGNQTKKVTLVIPESVEIMDVRYYWKTSSGEPIKTIITLADDNLYDGTEAFCCKFPEEDGE